MINDIDLYRAIHNFKQKHPIRKEISGERSLEISQWIREYGRPSKTGLRLGGTEYGGFVNFDVDCLRRDYANDLIGLIEFKSFNGKVSKSQDTVLKTLDAMLKTSTARTRYVGLSVVRFSHATAKDSDWIEWDGERISKQEFWRRFNFIDVLQSKGMRNG